MPRRSRDPRPGLTRHRVLEAALALVDEHGAQALTMRRLATALEVAPMTLYGHVAGRDELLDGLAEVMVAGIGVRFGDAPLEALRRLAHGIRAVATAHPAAFQLVGMRPLGTGASLAPVEAGLGALRGLGLDDAEAVRAYRVLVGYVRGYALGEIATFTLQRGSQPPVPGPAVDPARHPHIAELAPLLASADRDETFALGVEVLLDGFAARGAAADAG